MTQESSLSELKGVGDALFKKFQKLGLNTVGELIDYYPRKYEDYSEVSTTNRLSPGMVSIKGKIKSAKGRYVRRGMHITEAIASDDFGSVRLIWFNQPYRIKSLSSNRLYYVSGNYELSRGRFSIMNPAIELASDFPANTARILPIYKETKGLDSRQIRSSLLQVIDLIEKLPETLPEWIVKNHRLLSRSQALFHLHFPKTPKHLKDAKKRLAFEEVFALSLASQLNKREIKSEKALVISFNEGLAKEFVKHLPFKLTDGQRKSIWRICQDLMKVEPMNRLVEGDVGSGKTVVAAMSALMVLADKKQVALMAPTELLARQHADTIYSLLRPLGYDSQVVLLVGGMSPVQKSKARESIKDGSAGFIIGTHALIQEKVNMNSLALVVIDEQHRFGVEQRKALMSKAGHMPHVLSLTATPIPRSLALTLYGELDITVLQEKPADRQAIKTEIIWPGDVASLYEKIDKQLEAGRQMFVVCPNISEASVHEAQSVEAVYRELSTGKFKHRRIGLLHGKLKSSDKQSVMQHFLDGDLDILVSTTVIEVGVDVPNATVMLVRSPERFGLAQLHQLRGRVGRNEHQGYCYLQLDGTDTPLKRLRALVSSSDGFKLAELDLDLRGPGAIYGTSQHGQLDLRLAQLSDIALINQATSCAKEFVEKEESFSGYPVLEGQISKLRAVTNLN